MAHEETMFAQEEAGSVVVIPGQPVVGTSYVSPCRAVWEPQDRREKLGRLEHRPAGLPEQRAEIGSEINAQDNTLVRALDATSTIGNRTSLAHHAVIRDFDIGNFAFAGLNSEVVDSAVETEPSSYTAPWSRA